MRGRTWPGTSNPSRLLNIHCHHQGLNLVADDANISNTFKDLFVALRSNYLTLRIGVKSIVEAYYSHHFSRQFSFCQNVPGSLKKEILTCIPKELGRVLQSSTLSSTSSKLLIPDSVSTSSLITKEYAHWWAKRNKTCLEKITRVVLKLNHLLNLEKGSKDNQVILVIETEVAESIAATSNRRHNMLVDAPITALSSENDIISALSISSGQLSNPQSLQKLIGLEEKVPVTPKGSIRSVNGISEFDLPKAEAVLNGDLQPVSKDDHPSIETLSKCPKVALPAILKKSPPVEDALEKSKKTLEALFWPSSSAEVIDLYSQSIKIEVRQVTDALIKEMGTYMKDTPPLKSHLKVLFDGASNYARTKLKSSPKKQVEELQCKEESINLSLHGAKGLLINFWKDVATKKEKVSTLEILLIIPKLRLKLWTKWRHFVRSQNET
ncbi:UNVERIFIED_CONTAM: hypothetical protein Scaly_1056600 [Sesamum calycinum]|uniref:Uncharacterized protein n=1 Tax=Sesamum calycinum TaxID=2727403 RepID=A0AAW2QKJ3_9LAMI